MRARWLTVAIVAVVALLAMPMAALASHSWGGYHWARTSSSFTLLLGDNVSGPWDSALSTAAADFSASTVLDTSVVAGNTSPKQCKPTAGMVEVCNSNYGFNGWLGIAQIWLDGQGHIAQGIVKLNDSYFSAAPYNTPEWRQMVTCQEIGHTFGLDHQDEDFSNANLGTCMDYTSNPASNQHPNAHDLDQLASIYAHTDGYDSYITTPSAPTSDGGKGGNGKGRPGTAGESDWGRAVGASASGRVDLFVLDLPSGGQVLTHVSWAN